MSKLLARLLFCLIPAIVAGGLIALIDKGAGLIIFICVSFFGIQMTAPKKDRGEF